MPETTTADWVRPRPGPRAIRIDALLAVVLAVGSVIVGLLYQRTGIYPDAAEPWVWAVGIALVALPLAARRRWPVPVAVLCSAGFFIMQQFAVPDLLVMQICLFMALYSVGAWEQNRRLAMWTRLLITLAMFAWVAVNLIISSSDTEMFPNAPKSGIFSAFATFAVIQILTNLLYFGGAIVFGERSWQSARARAELDARGAELAQERRTSAEQAVALERIAIARELHDVVAHHVSVMGIQAGAARRSLDRDPAQAAASLEIVEESAHEAVAELRRLVHTLRSPDADDPHSTVGLAQIPVLVDEASRAGMQTQLIVTGTPRPVPMLTGVALYRVAQEALTNVRKHAPEGAETTVRVRYLDGAVEVEVADDGAGLQVVRRSDGGYGLRGMRERVGAVGGTVHAARREHGGFLVRAHAPTSPAPEKEALA